MKNFQVKTSHYFLCLLFLFVPCADAELVEYEIDIREETVNYSGKDVQAMTIGGTIPGTLIEATEGDTLRITFHNRMDVETSIHWHGIILPNDQDGVPYVTTMPIRAHSSFTYEYPVIQSGTYWYHSHTGLQEQRGVYAALVFHPKEKAYEYDREHVVVLSDWTDENPNAVLRHLKRDGDYYALKKDSVQSWWGVIQNGWTAIGNRIYGSWIRMGPMDLSDVGYDAFLLNGKSESVIDADMKPGEKVLLRIINAAASTSFDVQFAQENIKVMASDGIDVVPVDVNRFRIAVAETYDVLIELPNDGQFELRATASDGTGHASGYFGKGERIAAPNIPRPNLYLVDHSQHGNHGEMSQDYGDHHQSHDHHAHHHHGHHGMHHSASIEVLSYEDLRSPTETTLPEENPVREMTFRLTGNMERYIWSFNDKVLKEADIIHIKKGENVRFRLVNETMMDHPIHLHGHFFRVLNRHGDYSPLKHTVEVKAMETTVIEFLADQDKDWVFHCHILYHMKSGMGRVLRYEGSMRSPELMQAMKEHKRRNRFKDWYAWGYVAPGSHRVEGFLRAAEIRNQLEVEWDNNYTGEYDVEPKYLRNVSRFLDVFVGGEFERDDHDETKNHATIGFRYVLPLLVEMEYHLNHEGGHEIGFHSELQITKRFGIHGYYRLGFEFEEEWDYSDLELHHEYSVSAEYEFNKTFSLIANYDSEHRAGAGLKVYF